MIGFGAIGQSIARSWLENPPRDHELSAILARPANVSAALALFPNALVTDSFAQFLSHAGKIVIEAAGHSAVVDYGARVVGSGRDFYVLSVGAFAQPDVLEAVRSAGIAGGGRILLPSGACAGFRALLAMRQSGLQQVVYESRKPPRAWRGTMAEEWLDLDALHEAEVFFRGSADLAALQFPRNANVAAAIALAGVGFQDTQIRLVADPTIERTRNSITARSHCSELKVEMVNLSTEENAKTSLITGLSVLSAIKQREDVLVFQ